MFYCRGSPPKIWSAAPVTADPSLPQVRHCSLPVPRFPRTTGVRPEDTADPAVGLNCFVFVSWHPFSVWHLEFVSSSCLRYLEDPGHFFSNLLCVVPLRYWLLFSVLSKNCSFVVSWIMAGTDVLPYKPVQSPSQTNGFAVLILLEATWPNSLWVSNKPNEVSFPLEIVV